MKRTILIILPLALFFMSHAPMPVEKINWLTIDEAIELNKTKPKGIFIDVYTDWCGWCKKMDASTFVNPGVVKLMNEHFYAVKLNSEQYKKPINFKDHEFNFDPSLGRRGVHEFAVNILQGKLSYPSYAIIDDNNELVTVIPGYREAKEFKPMLEFLGDEKYEKQTFQEFMSEYNKDK